MLCSASINKTELGTLARLWADPAAEERERFKDLLERDPWQTPIGEWAQTDPMLFKRLLTVRIWLRQRLAFN